MFIMKKRNLVIVAFLLVCVGGYSTVRGEVASDRVAAVVNKDLILESDIKKHKQPLMRSFINLPLGITSSDKVPTERDILDELIVMHLLEQEADRKGLKVDDKVLDATIESIMKRNNLTKDQFILHLVASGLTYVEYRKLMKRQLTLSRLISAEVAQKVPLSEEDAQRYFKENKGHIDEAYQRLLDSQAPARPQEAPKTEIPKEIEVYTGGKIRLRQITLKMPKGGKNKDQEHLREQAKLIYREASSGADFAQLAKKYSKDNLASSGGDLGMMNYKDMAQGLQKMVQRFKAGEVIPPMPTREGVIIFYLADATGRTKKKVPIPEVERKRIEKQMKEAYERQAAEQKKKDQSANAGSSEDETEVTDPKAKTEKPTGILTPEEEKEYKKVRKKVMGIVRTEKIQARMKEWIEELKKNSIIEVKL
jgi:peptidyl-prolyl cis-trans isomerase SurA